MMKLRGVTAMTDRAPEDRALAMSVLEVIACATAMQYAKGWAVNSRNEASYWASLPGVKRFYWLKAVGAGLEAAKAETDDPAVLKWIDKRLDEYPFRDSPPAAPLP
jgi:hypothetical protein